MEVPVEIRKAHAQLSNANERFLDFVRDRPEYLLRSEFPGLTRLEELAGYGLHAWPVFLSTAFLDDFQRGNRELCHLIKVMPHRVFGNDVSQFASFYDLDEGHAQLVVATFSNQRWVAETISRGDFMLTEDGFKCLEYNVASCIGGWPSSWAAEGLMQIPPVHQFISEHDMAMQKGHTIKKLAGYLVRQGLKRFSSDEVNIVALVAPGDLQEGNQYGHVQLVETLREEMEGVERLLGGKVRCRLLEAVPEQLQERNGMLYVEQVRVHAVLEGEIGFAGAASMRCWVKGTVDLYNGPATPVMNDKRNLALLSELKDSELVSETERQVVEGFLPWTRRVSKDKLHPQAVEPVSRHEIIERRSELVLKPSNEKSGKDVYLGRTCDEATWEEVLDRAYEEGHWVVQEVLDSASYLCQQGDQGAGQHKFLWGPFLFGDRDGGVNLRVTPSQYDGPINGNVGAKIAITLVVDEGQGNHP